MSVLSHQCPICFCSFIYFSTNTFLITWTLSQYKQAADSFIFQFWLESELTSCSVLPTSCWKDTTSCLFMDPEMGFFCPQDGDITPWGGSTVTET